MQFPLNWVIQYYYKFCLDLVICISIIEFNSKIVHEEQEEKEEKEEER